MYSPKSRIQSQIIFKGSIKQVCILVREHVWSKVFSREGKQTTNLASVNLTKLSAFPVPLPPTEEQKVIIEKIETHLSISDESEKIINQNLMRANRLRQSLLNNAFEGKLVPQDPNDEPATVLLDRIMAEKAGQFKRTRGSKSNDNRQMRLINDR